MSTQSSLYTTSNASSNDRLSFTIFLALVFHGLLIFGIAFELSKPVESAPSVTVTLSTSRSLEAPATADFIAQNNQLGSGTLAEAQQITTDKLSPFSSQTIEATDPRSATRAASKPLEKIIITSVSSAERVKKTISNMSQVDVETGKDARNIQKIGRAHV
jgi:protein TonB